MTVPQLGDPAAAEQLLVDLYVDLRQRIRRWSEITRQTPQARMGYVGQHLASVVTGFPGGRSGARGHDLELPGNLWAEIKTCYRVDQLGSCSACGAAVSSIEDECPRCGGHEMVRKDDSKWLIGVRNDEEMASLFSPAFYYLVLFDLATQEDAADAVVAEEADGELEFVTTDAPTILSRIWRVDPRQPGFSMCMVDYYVNIRAKSRSKAPFNLWPFSLKFQLMRPELMYQARILPDDTVATDIFEGAVGLIQPYPISPLTTFSGSHVNLRTEGLLRLARDNRVKVGSGRRRDVLAAIEDARRANGWDDDWLAAQLAELLYRERIAGEENWLPPPNI